MTTSIRTAGIPISSEVQQAVGRVDLDQPSASDTVGTIAATNGTSTSAPVGGLAPHSSSPPAVCSTSATVPTSTPATVRDPQTLELVVVELVGVV